MVFTEWAEPTAEEKKAIRNPLDIPIIAVIKGVSPEDRKLIYDSIDVKDEFRGHYKELQLPWVSDFKGYWAKNHNNKDPDEYVGEFIEDYKKSCENERYRLYYAAKYPEKIEIKKVNRKVLEFLLEAEEFLRIEKLIISTTQ